MPIRDDALIEPYFWAAVYSGSLGQIGEPPDVEMVCSHFGTNERKLIDWWHTFTGWSPDCLKDSDGCSVDPATIWIKLANRVFLFAEFHPGDMYWFLARQERGQVMLANVGPHWALPGLRWEEALSIAKMSNGPAWSTLLFLLPVVWLTADDDLASVRLSVEIAWIESGLLSSMSAKSLTQLWVKAVYTRNYRWHHELEAGWICSAEWSTRSKKRPAEKSELLNLLIAEAMRTT